MTAVRSRNVHDLRRVGHHPHGLHCAPISFTAALLETENTLQRCHEVKRGGAKESDARGEPATDSARRGGAAFSGLAFGMLVEQPKCKDATPESAELGAVRDEQAYFQN